MPCAQGRTIPSDHDPGKADDRGSLATGWIYLLHNSPRKHLGHLNQLRYNQNLNSANILDKQSARRLLVYYLLFIIHYYIFPFWGDLIWLAWSGWVGSRKPYRLFCPSETSRYGSSAASTPNAPNSGRRGKEGLFYFFLCTTGIRTIVRRRRGLSIIVQWPYHPHHYPPASFLHKLVIYIIIE